MVSTAGTAVSVFPEWRFPNAGLRGHGGRNIQRYMRKKDELSAEITLIIQNEQGKSLKLNYKGPVSGVKETLSNGVVKAFGDEFSLKDDGHEISLQNSGSINSNLTMSGKKEDDRIEDNKRNQRISSDKK